MCFLITTITIRFNVPYKLFSHCILVQICPFAAVLRADNSIIQSLYPERSGKLEFCHPFFRLIFSSFVQFGNHLWLECVTGYPAEVIVYFVYWVKESLYRISGGLCCSDFIYVVGEMLDEDHWSVCSIVICYNASFASAKRINGLEVLK